MHAMVTDFKKSICNKPIGPKTESPSCAHGMGWEWYPPLLGLLIRLKVFSCGSWDLGTTGRST